MTHKMLGAAAVVLALAGSLAGCGSSGTTSASTSVPSTIPVTTSSTAPTTSTVPQIAATAVWPTLASGTRFADPVKLVQAFATQYLHFVTPVVGAFRAGDSRSGEVTVRHAPAAGPTTTVIVRQVAGDGTWWVLGAATPNIRITDPAPLATITSPLRLRGTSTAFEAEVRVEIRADGATAPLAAGHVMGGSMGTMGPFDGTFAFTPTASSGAIVMFTISAADGHVAEATVIRVHFAAP